MHRGQVSVKNTARAAADCGYERRHAIAARVAKFTDPAVRVCVCVPVHCADTSSSVNPDYGFPYVYFTAVVVQYQGRPTLSVYLVLFGYRVLRIKVPGFRYSFFAGFYVVSGLDEEARSWH